MMTNKAQSLDESLDHQKMSSFERYLSLWVLLCIICGIFLGKIAGDSIFVLSSLNIATVNVPVAILVGLMIFPMMAQIDFNSIKKIRNNPKGVALTLIVNWLIKPFTMAFFAWIFFNKIYSAYLSPKLAKEYIAGAILLGAAPCTAMVFVWSYLSKGDPEYTLVQVAINDLVLLVLFVPIVRLLLGITNVTIPFETLISSVIIFVVIPLTAGYAANKWLIHFYGDHWFRSVFLPKLKPISIMALLSTLVLLFAFQGKKITSNPLHILLIAIPLTIQTYFIFLQPGFLDEKQNFLTALFRLGL